MIRPENLVRDAVATIDGAAWAGDRITVLLGTTNVGTAKWSLASDFVYLYADKGSRWNTSFVFTDELVPELAQRIVNAPIQMQPGELVIVNRDETTLGPIEAGILRRLKAETMLCPLRIAAQTIVAYRVGGPDGCGSDGQDLLP
jgi:hypothetical protein